MPAVARFR